MSRRSAPTAQQVEAAAAMEAISTNAETLIENNFSVPGHLSNGAITRQFAVDFAGSLSEMADSPSLASWSPTELSIFQSRTRYAPNCAKSEFRQGNLQQAILSKCLAFTVVLQVHVLHELQHKEHDHHHGLDRVQLNNRNPFFGTRFMHCFFLLHHVCTRSLTLVFLFIHSWDEGQEDRVHVPVPRRRHNFG